MIGALLATGLVVLGVLDLLALLVLVLIALLEWRRGRRRQAVIDALEAENVRLWIESRAGRAK